MNPASPATRSTFRVDVQPDNRGPNNTPSKPREDQAPVEIDRRRLFYMRSSQHNGAFLHTWDYYLVDMDKGTVDVHWVCAGGLGFFITLSGRDVQAFLQITRDRNGLELFQDR